jgi:heterodisulfide reductase subunit D
MLNKTDHRLTWESEMDCDLLHYYSNVKEKLIRDCIKCGNCVTGCRAMEFISPKKSPSEIQADILDFFATGVLSSEARVKTDSCIPCFGCLDIECPIGVDSLTINELVHYESEKIKKEPWNQDLFPMHQTLLIENTSSDEYEKLTTLRIKEDAKYVFFAGCNVYKQPDKLLNALEIMDAITDDYSFIPGLEYCCGAAHRTLGNLERVQTEAKKLMNLVSKIKPEKLILWCPTCLCQIENRLKLFLDIPCECITFGQFVFSNINKLDFSHAIPHKVTFHEPCKTSYMKLDVDSVRNILQAIPGTDLIEMAHNRDNTLCCRCNPNLDYPDICDTITSRRLSEAKATGAEVLIDVCHNCHWVFMPAQELHPEFDFTIENYSTYILEAMGKRREDTLKKKML